MKVRIPNDALIHFFDLMIQSRKECNALRNAGNTKKYTKKIVSLRNEVMKYMLFGEYSKMDKFVRQSIYLIFNQTRSVNDPHEVLQRDGLFMFGSNVLSLANDMQTAIATNGEIKWIATQIIDLIRNMSPFVVDQNEGGKLSYKYAGEELEHIFQHFRSTIINSVHHFVQYEESKIISSNHRRIMGHGWVSIRSAIHYCGYWRMLAHTSDTQKLASMNDNEKKHHIVGFEDYYWINKLSTKKIAGIIDWTNKR